MRAKGPHTSPPRPPPARCGEKTARRLRFIVFFVELFFSRSLIGPSKYSSNRARKFRAHTSSGKLAPDVDVPVRPPRTGVNAASSARGVDRSGRGKSRCSRSQDRSRRPRACLRRRATAGQLQANIRPLPRPVPGHRPWCSRPFVAGEPVHQRRALVSGLSMRVRLLALLLDGPYGGEKSAQPAVLSIICASCKLQGESLAAKRRTQEKA